MNAIVTFLIRMVELMFAVGVLGSAIVLILSGIEDIETLVGSDEVHSV
jgi:hypothetical protein